MNENNLYIASNSFGSKRRRLSPLKSTYDDVNSSSQDCVIEDDRPSIFKRNSANAQINLNGKGASAYLQSITEYNQDPQSPFRGSDLSETLSSGYTSTPCSSVSEQVNLALDADDCSKPLRSELATSVEQLNASAENLVCFGMVISDNLQF
jgi:hypothetical protein